MRPVFQTVKVFGRFVSSNSSSRLTWTKMNNIRPQIFSRFRWYHVPLGYTFAFITFGQLRKYRLQRIEKENENDSILPEHYQPLPLEVSMYRILPLRTLSRFWGWLNSLELPLSMRSPILKSYTNMFGCDLNEANDDDLSHYRNLGEFFRRALKPGLRPIEGDDMSVVSPSDGTILHLGPVKEGCLQPVKGITYSLDTFLGPVSWRDRKSTSKKDDYQESLLQNQNKSSELYYCVIYLAPGDYHRFHSPVDWTIRYRRHFPGKLYSVRPTFVSWFPNLFSVNERVAYTGSWKYGFFSMVAVGATNVGSIRIYFDEQLKTNRTQISFRTSYEDKPLQDVKLCKGDPFGEFNLGSTIVLIFEAPKGMQFTTDQNTKIKYGQLLCRLENQFKTK